MRKVVITAFLTLDGVMQAPGGPEEDPTGGFAHGGWSVNYWDDAMLQTATEMIQAPSDLLIGRKTYEIFAAHWPYMEGPIADKLNSATKYVATTTLETLEWKNAKAIRGDVAAEVARLKQEDGPDLLIQGSTQLVQTLLTHNLIDDFCLWTFPIVVGPGKRLFGSGTVHAGLKLIETNTTATGVVISRYVRGEAASVGSFAQEQPSQAEFDRREKMKREDRAGSASGV